MLVTCNVPVTESHVELLYSFESDALPEVEPNLSIELNVGGLPLVQFEHKVVYVNDSMYSVGRITLVSNSPGVPLSQFITGRIEINFGYVTPAFANDEVKVVVLTHKREATTLTATVVPDPTE